MKKGVSPKSRVFVRIHSFFVGFLPQQLKQIRLILLIGQIQFLVGIRNIVGMILKYILL